MTTERKLPDHGTQYRYRGATDGSWPGCRCALCTTVHSRACKRRALARLNGQGPLYPGTPLIAHIDTLTASGMSQALIARRANVAPATISYLLRGLTKSCQREKALRILAVQPRDFDELAERPATGTQRRIRALYVLGHSPSTIAAAAGLDTSAVSHIANSRYETTDGRTASAIRHVFQQLALTPGTSTKSRRIATAEGWPPAGAWDDIDDPASRPDWTGYCGTDRGFWTHRNQRLPMCQPCQDAHDQWVAERANLTVTEKRRQAAYARAEVRNRGAEIAHDGRELMRQGHTCEQAADRIGVTRQHLQQEMYRHPERLDTAA